MNVTLTPSNVAALAKYADYLGLTPETFLNNLVEEFIDRLNDPRCGEIEILIGKFSYPDAITANRAAAWVKEYVSDPDLKPSLNVEVIQTPEGTYRIQADWV